MGFLSRLFGRVETRSGLTLIRSGAPSLGPLAVALSESEARRSSVVGACLSWSSNAASEAPAGVFVPDESGEASWSEDHPLTRLLADPLPEGVVAARPQWSGARLIFAWVYSLNLSGNAYAYLLRNDAGRIVGLDYLPHGAIMPVAVPGAISRLSHYRIAGVGQSVAPADVLHITLGADPDAPLLGLSPLAAVARQVLADNEIARYQHGIVRSPVPGLIITPKGDTTFTADAAQAIKARYEAEFGGERVGGTIVASDGIEVHPVGYSPKDLTLDALARLPEERIAAALNIPPIVVGLGAGLERGTLANYEQARRQALDQHLIPRWRVIADALTTQVLDRADRAQGLRCGFDLRRVQALQEDVNALHERVRADFASNLIDRASALRMLDVEPTSDDEGVYAWQLRAMPGMALPPVTEDARAARRRAERDT